MTLTMTPVLPAVLLFEPQFVLRRTVASAARRLGIAEVHEAATLQAAARLAQRQRYELALVALDGAPTAALSAFVQACGAGLVLGLSAAGVDPSAAGVAGTIPKPLKVRQLLHYLGR